MSSFRDKIIQVSQLAVNTYIDQMGFLRQQQSQSYLGTGMAQVTGFTGFTQDGTSYGQYSVNFADGTSLNVNPMGSQNVGVGDYIFCAGGVMISG